MSKLVELFIYLDEVRIISARFQSIKYKKRPNKIGTMAFEKALIESTFNIGGEIKGARGGDNPLKQILPPPNKNS